MLIDNYLQHYQFLEKHQIVIDATQKRTKDVFDKMTVSDYCYAICSRGVIGTKIKKKDLFTSFMKKRFIPLDEIQNEIVVGLIGQFWLNRIVKVHKDNFNDYTKYGYPKLVWSISFKEIGLNKTLVRTETRIQCDDKKAKRIFSLYWLIIKPFSGLTRKYLLWKIKQKTEKGNG